MNIIEVKKLSFSFSPKKEVLKEVVINIKKGEVLGVMGESGSGKSTFAGCLCGLNKNYRGSILYNKPIIESKGCVHGVHMIFQDPYSSINPKLKVLEAVSEGLLIKRGKVDKILHQKVEDSLNRVGLPGEYIYKKIDTLSGGERQKVAIARALILEPALFIFDEATVNLDLISQREILAVIQSLKKEGKTMIIISHNETLLKLLSDRIALMEDGEIICVTDN